MGKILPLMIMQNLNRFLPTGRGGSELWELCEDCPPMNQDWGTAGQEGRVAWLPGRTHGLGGVFGEGGGCGVTGG